MPTISVNLEDLQGLLGEKVSLDRLEDLLRLAKAELGDLDEASGEIRIELNDTNRPDLWCTEGLARQLKSHLTGRAPAYPFFAAGAQPARFIEVDPGLKEIRPFVAAFSAKGPPLSDAALRQIIQTQEKLCENYGRKRRNVAIGVYNADRIAFPVRFVAAPPDRYAFTPLGAEEAMPLARIVKEHPKGKEYGPLLEGLPAFPLLLDSEGKTLSMPPIINSRETGEVKVGDAHLFVEATGSDMRQLLLSMNIMAVNFADRGWEIEPVETRLPYDSSLGRTDRAPRDLEGSLSLDKGEFARLLGDPFGAEEIAAALRAYGVDARAEGDTVRAACPPFRDDFLHAVDVVEDFAISRGYNRFQPVMPSRFTVGKLKPLTMLEDRVREQMVGLGFEEVFSNILTNRRDERDHMLLEDEPLVAVENVMTETYSVLRANLLPSLLRVEAQSGKALYPHKLFETGEVGLLPGGPGRGCATERRLAAIWAAADSGFSQIHSVLDMLFHYLVEEYQLRPATFPFYFEGRAGEVVRGGRVVGHIGEVHPEVLTRFKIQVPCAAFEIALDPLL